MFHWCGSLGSVTFRGIAGRTNSPELVHLKLNWICYLPQIFVLKFFRSAYLSWVNEESPAPPHQLLRLGRDIISTTVAMVTGHCVMGPLRKRRLSSTSFVSARLLLDADIGRLFGSPFLVSLMVLSSIDIKDIASFIKLSSWFSSLG